MKRYSRTLFPPLGHDHSTLALRPVMISGLVTPVKDGDGGVNISIVEDNPSGVLAAVDPWQDMQVGDRVDIHWDGVPVGGRDVIDADIDKRMYFYLPTDPIKPDWAEKVLYSLIRTGSTVPDESVPLRLRVKLDRPAGLDSDPHLPGHSELAAPQLPQDVIDNGVDAQWAKNGIPVTIAAYPGRAARDTVELRWGVVPLFGVITEEQAAGTAPIVIDVNQEAILAAGDSTNLLVHYQVYDEVWNFSEQWSLQTFVPVDAGAWKLSAPIIQEAINGEIDLGNLGSTAVTVKIPVTADPFERDDTVTMTWLGTTAAGAPLTYSQSITISNIPAIYDTSVPNALVRQLINGTAQASYVLTKANGDPPQSSKRANVKITGVAPLQIPRILELIGDVLDPHVERAHAEIPVYDGMANGDLIALVWMGTRVDGAPYLYEAQHMVSDNEVGDVVYIPVAGEHIALLENGTVDVSYRVSNDAWQIFDVRVSEHLFVKVGQYVSQLPAPIIVEAPDGVLDPEVNPGNVTLRVNYTGTVNGDTLTWYWLGHPGTGSGSNWIPITVIIAGTPVNFTIPRSLIEPNINDKVRVLYTLKRGATGLFEYSATLNLVIGKLIGELPAPVVLEAGKDKPLDPMDALNGVTVQVSYASMEEQDDITQIWLGSPGVGSPADQEASGSDSGLVNFSVPAQVVGANIGRDVSISYRVKRYTAAKQSDILRLPVLPFGEPDKDLPHPVITQADEQTLTLNLATFTGNGTATVAKWPFIATGQRVWLRLEGETSSGGPHTITLLDGVAINSSQATGGLSEAVLRTELEKLGQDTRLTLMCNVAFDGTASESTAVQFPVTTYTFKLHHDWVSPQIISVKDSKGEVNEGAITFDTSVALTGTSTLEAELEILDDKTPLTSTRANGSGAWNIDLSGLKVKNYSLTAHALDGSGLISQPRRFEVVANLTPTITQAVGSNGPISNGGSTVETSITLSGQGSPDQQIELFEGKDSKGTARTNGAGAWSMTLSDLTVASHAFKAKALYGTQPESTEWTIIVTQAVTPTINSVKDSNTVEIPPDGFTVDTSVVLTGSASANLEVEIFDGADSKGKAKADAGGQWTLELKGLSVAVHAMMAKADYASHPESPKRKFTITAVVTPTITNVVDSNGTPVADRGETFANTLTLSGKASINQPVEVFDGATSKGTASANANGDWSRQVSGLGTGPHSLTAKALYANHPVSLPWTINVLAATVPVVTSVRDSQKEIPNAGKTTETTVTVSGNAAAGQQVEVFDNSKSKGRVSVTAAGEWTQVIGGLALTGHSVKAIARYGDEPESNVRTFTVESPVPPLVIDPSAIALSGKLYRPTADLSVNPISWPANSTSRRTPSSGAPPYTYTSSNSAIVKVTGDGTIYSQSNGNATITVRDSQGRSGSYPVSVSGVILVHLLGNTTYKAGVKLAAANGKRIPSLGELREIHGQYGSGWPQGEARFYSWSTDGAGLFQNWTKNLVTSDELPFEIKFENFGAYAHTLGI